MEKGDIFYSELCESNGYEQSGSRPVIVIVSYDDIDLVTVVPLTSQPDVSRFTDVHKIEPDNINNLNKVSYAMLFQIGALDKKRLIKKNRTITRTEI